MLRLSRWRTINVLRIIFAVKHKRRIWHWMHADGDMEVLPYEESHPKHRE